MGRAEKFSKELGGYLPLDLEHLGGASGPYYQGSDTAALHSGRAAIWYALKDSGAKRLYLPSYLCQSMLQSPRALGIEVCFYPIGGDLLPLDLDFTTSSEEAFLFIHYFGVLNPKKIERLAARHANFLLDNTQAFFCQPLPNAYTIYSTRKFFGVSDGGYVVKQGLKDFRPELELDVSWPHALHLLRSLEESTHSAYPQNLQNETRFDERIAKRMSVLTASLLARQDYGAIQAKRTRNFFFLHQAIGSHNALEALQEISQGCLPNLSPMVYPLLWEGEGLREFLIERKVYIPTWWREVLRQVPPKSWEAKLCRYLLPLPIDQRYDLKDMEGLLGHLRDFGLPIKKPTVREV